MNIIEKAILLPLFLQRFFEKGEETVLVLTPCNYYNRVLLHYGSILSHPIKFFGDDLENKPIPINR